MFKTPKSLLRADTLGCIPPEVQDAFAPTPVFSAIGVCAGQVEGGAHNCCSFGSLGSQIVQRTKKRQNRFVEMSGMLCSAPERPILCCSQALGGFNYLMFDLV